MIQTTVMLNNKKGMTLVEVLVALVILLFVSLALMQTALVSVDSSMKNNLRDEAVRIAEMRMDDTRALSFDNVQSDTMTITRYFRNITAAITYSTTRTVTTLANLDNKQIDISVQWQWKGQSYTHTISSLVSRPIVS